MSRIPTALDDVAGWAESIRQERLNETGRRAIDMVELAVTDWLTAREESDDATDKAQITAKVLPTIERLLRTAYAADKVEVDRALVELRTELEERKALDDKLSQMH